MRIEPGQVAVITGGGSGIGRALAVACAQRGMAIAIGDIESAAADETVHILKAKGARAFAQHVDVTKAGDLAAFAERAYSEFSRCDLLCNNAGVLVLGPLEKATPADWKWVLDVNLYGVLHGLDAFLPRMLEAGRPGHILNSVSLRGVAGSPGCGVYSASKYGVLALTETLHAELANRRIGVTALCPWSVNTAIVASERNRPDARSMSPEALQKLIDAAPSSEITIEPDQVAQVALEAVEDNELYAITHPCARDLLKARFDGIMSSLERVRVRHPELP
jgi:NAD(P)-dependent dehydrogenase (short-subunit alcohol dehydrogenase family)